MQVFTKRTHTENADFINLVKELDAFLTVKNGDSDAFYSQFNNLDTLNHVIVLYADEKPIGCGALKHYTNDTVEIKRMYIRKQLQGKNFGALILKELEAWAKELDYKRCILETGTMLPEAIHFYKKYAYQQIPNYDQYIGAPESVCFEKKL